MLCLRQGMVSFLLPNYKRPRRSLPTRDGTGEEQ
jgi:hypothetical protein